MRTVMITGDHHNTAIAVAKDVGMVRSEENLLLIDTTTQARPFPSAQSLASGQAANIHEPLMSAKSRVRFDLDSGQAQAGPDSTSVASAVGSLHAGSVGSINDLLLHRDSTPIRANGWKTAHLLARLVSQGRVQAQECTRQANPSEEAPRSSVW